MSSDIEKVQPKGVLEFPDPDNPEGSSDLIAMTPLDLDMHAILKNSPLAALFERKSLGSKMASHYQPQYTKGWRKIVAGSNNIGTEDTLFGVNGKLKDGSFRKN